jgi:hypothetical protein
VKTILKVAAGIILAVVLLVVGCTALLATGGASDSIDQDEYASIQQGMTRAEVEDRLGDPADTQDMEIQIPEIAGQGGETLSHDCIYYNREGDITGIYQFCFENDVLTSKASY